jgi:hypothetical protein
MPNLRNPRHLKTYLNYGAFEGYLRTYLVGYLGVIKSLCKTFLKDYLRRHLGEVMG